MYGPPTKRANTRPMSATKNPKANPAAPHRARTTAFLRSLIANPSDAPPNVPITSSPKRKSNKARSEGPKGLTAKLPAMAPPMPNPTAPKMTNRITLVALMASYLSVLLRHQRGLLGLMHPCSEDGKAHQRPG